jgi:hypothetical protein
MEASVCRKYLLEATACRKYKFSLKAIEPTPYWPMRQIRGFGSACLAAMVTAEAIEVAYG